MRMKASTTGCPPLVVTGLENELVITSTDIPGSMRIPLQLNLLFVVILKRGIIKFYHALVFSVQARLSFHFQAQKKRGELTCCPFHASEALAFAYYSRTDNVRAHADMKDAFPYTNIKERTPIKAYIQCVT